MILLPITSESHDTCHSFGFETSRPINKKFFFPSFVEGSISLSSRERENRRRSHWLTHRVRQVFISISGLKKRKRETKININISPTAVHDSKREGVPYPFGKEKEKKTYVPIAKTPGFVGKRELRESGS